MQTTIEQTENVANMPKGKPKQPKTKTAKSKVFSSKKLPKPRKRRK